MGSACGPKASVGGWICTKCGEAHPAQAAVCWRCGTDVSGVADPGFVPEEPGEPPEPEAAPRTAEPPPLDLSPCRRCGSKRILPDVVVCDRVDAGFKELSAVVYRNPDALIFKGALYGKLRARICGDCGYVELHILNPNEFYQSYRKTRP